MKVSDILYFAPGIRFDQVDLCNPDLSEQFRLRVQGFYIEPAQKCAELRFAFAAGVLLVSCIDGLARLRYGQRVGDRFRKFAREQLKSFDSDYLAKRFYLEFRNGLLHETRLKEGAQFSLEISTTVDESGGLLLVNPCLLAVEVQSALDAYVALVNVDATEFTRLCRHLERDLAKDFNAARS